jgi:hypothetical protein
MNFKAILLFILPTLISFTFSANTIFAQSISTKGLIGTTWTTGEFNGFEPEEIFEIKFVDKKTIHLKVIGASSSSKSKNWIGTYKEKNSKFIATFKYYLEDSKKVKAELEFEGWCPLLLDGSGGCRLEIDRSTMYELNDFQFYNLEK